MSDAFARLRAEWRLPLLGRLDEHLARLRWSSDRLRVHQRDRLRSLLATAIAGSRFHRDRLDGVDPARFELEDLPTLPVMTKADLMDHLGDVFTDPELTCDAVERALAATTDTPVPILGRHVAVASGGSSGRRAVFVHDREAVLELVGSQARGLLARLDAGGPRPPGALPIAMVCAASAVHATGAAPAWTAPGDLPFRFLGVPVTLPLDEIVARLERLDAPVLYGYPSMLLRLAAERAAQRLHVSPRMVVSTAETLTAEARATITEAFGAPVIDNFGSSEGLVGHGAPDDPTFTFNSDVCLVELLDREGRPAPAGVAADRILITNLASRVQPLIRYELGDRFVRAPAAPEHGYLRARVEGRADEVLRFRTVDVHPHVIRAVLVTTPEVADYQVHQTPDGVALRVMPAASLDLDLLRSRLVAALGAAGLPSPVITAEIVGDLPRDARTGKLRRFVPLAG